MIGWSRRAPLMLLAAVVAPLSAQSNPSTVDFARSSFGLSIGILTGSPLWTVHGQAIQDGPPIHTDSLTLIRDLPSSITVVANYTRFLSRPLGVTFEASYIGLASEDGCTVTHDEHDVAITTACADFHGTSYASGNSLSLQAGGVWRPATGSTLQPYLKGTAGMATLGQSPASVTIGERISGGSSFVVYTDAGWSSLRPAATVSAGVGTGAIAGMQFHIEARELFVVLPEITGANAFQGEAAQVRNRTRRIFGVVAGLELVLKRSHSRRY